MVPVEERWSWFEGSWDGENVAMEGRYVRSARDENGEAVVRRLELGLDAWVDVLWGGWVWY